LRWSLTLCLLLLIPILTVIALSEGLLSLGLYSALFWLQLLFLCRCATRLVFRKQKNRVKILFVPYYFFIMNLSVVLGFFRYVKNSQSVNWERSKSGIIGKINEPLKIK
jgi:hypothetical protein